MTALETRSSYQAWAIRFLHVAFVAFVVLAPFSNDPRALVLHVLMLPLVWVHWVLNDDSCVLTILEQRLRGVTTKTSFFHALVSPVYSPPDASVRRVCWVGSMVLWIIAASKVQARDMVNVLSCYRA